MYVNTYSIDMVPGKHPLFLHITQYEKGLREFTFVPYSSTGTMEYVSGASVTLEATKPDGHAVIHECIYNSDGSITYELSDQLATTIGRVWSKLVIRDGEDVLGTAAIVWVVDPAGVQDGAIISESDLSGLEAFKRQMISLVGTPIAVTVASSMTDQDKIYLYMGSETGYMNGYWYYWNGSEWSAGGEYGSTGGSIPVVTDDGNGNITIG